MKKAAAIMSVELEHDAIVIRCRGLIHVHIRRSEYLGFQSWRNGENNYAVEFTLRDSGVLLCEYDTREKWECVLRGLEKVLLGRINATA